MNKAQSVIQFGVRTGTSGIDIIPGNGSAMVTKLAREGLPDTTAEEESILWDDSQFFPQLNGLSAPSRIQSHLTYRI